MEKKVGRCQRILTAQKAYCDCDYDSDSDGSKKVAWVSCSENFSLILKARKKLPDSEKNDKIKSMSLFGLVC